MKEKIIRFVNTRIEAMKRNRFLFEELVKRDFTKKYKRTILGMLWSILGPLMTLAVMALVFSQFFGQRIPHYVIYLFCGNLIFNFFKESTMTGMTSLYDNSSIFSKVNVPKYMFLMSRNVSAIINFGINLFLFFMFCVLDHITFSWKFITLLFPIANLILFNFGFGLILSALYLMFRDMKYLYDIFTLMLMYVSAIFYSVDTYSEQIQHLFFLNPVYLYIYYFRSVVLYNTIPGLAIHLMALAYSIVAFVIGAIIYKTKNYKFLYYI